MSDQSVFRLLSKLQQHLESKTKRKKNNSLRILSEKDNQRQSTVATKFYQAIIFGTDQEESQYLHKDPFREDEKEENATDLVALHVYKLSLRGEARAASELQSNISQFYRCKKIKTVSGDYMELTKHESIIKFLMMLKDSANTESTSSNTTFDMLEDFPGPGRRKCDGLTIENFGQDQSRIQFPIYTLSAFELANHEYSDQLREGSTLNTAEMLDYSYADNQNPPFGSGSLLSSHPEITPRVQQGSMSDRLFNALSSATGPVTITLQSILDLPELPEPNEIDVDSGVISSYYPSRMDQAELETNIFPSLESVLREHQFPFFGASQLLDSALRSSDMGPGLSREDLAFPDDAAALSYEKVKKNEQIQESRFEAQSCNWDVLTDHYIQSGPVLPFVPFISDQPDSIFDKQYSSFYGNTLEAETKTLSIPEVVKILNSAVLGIPSEYFRVDAESPSIYSCRHFRLKGTSVETMDSLSEEIAFLGTAYVRVNAVCAFFQEDLTRGGLIVQAFTIAVQKLLMRFTLDLMSLESESNLLQYSWNLRKKATILKVLNEILVTVFTSRQTEREYYDFVRCIQQLRRGGIDQGFVRKYKGAVILGHLYQSTKVATRDQITLHNFLFYESVQPLIRFMHRWINYGELEDHYNEFPVWQNPDARLDDGAQFWDATYLICAENTPIFLTECLPDLLNAGKTMSLISRTIQKSAMVTRRSLEAISSHKVDLDLFLGIDEISNHKVEADQLFKINTERVTKDINMTNDALETIRKQAAQAKVNKIREEGKRIAEERKKKSEYVQMQHEKQKSLLASVKAEIEERRKALQQATLDDAEAEQNLIAQLDVPFSLTEDQYLRMKAYIKEEMIRFYDEKFKELDDRILWLQWERRKIILGNPKFTWYRPDSDDGALESRPQPKALQVDSKDEKEQLPSEYQDVQDVQDVMEAAVDTVETSTDQTQAITIQGQAPTAEHIQSQSELNGSLPPNQTDAFQPGFRLQQADQEYVKNMAFMEDNQDLVNPIPFHIILPEDQTNQQSNTVPMGPQSTWEYGAIEMEMHSEKVGGPATDTSHEIEKESLTHFTHDEHIARSFSNRFQTPLHQIIYHCLQKPISKQSQALSSYLNKVLWFQFQLDGHLKALRSYALMNAGDLYDSFWPMIFSRSQQLLGKIHLTEINRIWEICVRQSSYGDDPFIVNISFSLDGTTNRTENHTAYGFDSLKIVYKAPWPIDIIARPSSMEKYNTIFRFLLKLSEVNYRIKQMWMHFQKMMLRDRRPSKSGMEMMLFRNQIQHFFGTLQAYIMTQVHETSWKRLQDSLHSKDSTVSHMISLHEQYLDNMIDRCLLSSRAKPVLSIIEEMCKTVNDFAQKISLMDEDTESSLLGST
eukprot:TRINITY_DN4785_c0_g1_i3.p1 TRINITY_DN4785_c0_g1~~TRINITY_DN4785_c0_g1_i3.p1  ORF type:complete len:1369 (+),score=212.97 TRINITY_DN4785_c0_g1_i3:37-4143(+)